MDIRVLPTALNGVLEVEVASFEDHRGFFFESYHHRRFAEHGIPHAFVQDNHARSARGVIRAIHYQDKTAPQFRLFRCTSGTVWYVVVDLRPDSPTLGRWLGFTLSAENRKQVLIPPEFGHGFGVLSEWADIHYKCSQYYIRSSERTIAWNDPDIAIEWPIANPILSARDAHARSFKEYLACPDFEPLAQSV